MNTRFMGNTGLRVSDLCLGAMTFGGDANEADSHAIMDRFVEAGGNFIDTADVYGRGISEEIVGTWLKQQNRDDMVIATKVRFPMGDGPNDLGLSRKHIMAGVEGSLRRLQSDYIDLYQVHCWDHITPLEETLSALNRLVEDGKVRYIGVSNYSGWQLQKAIDISRSQGWEAYTCLQPQYNLLERGIEWEVTDVCLNEGVGIIPWSPLRGGWLSGKYHRGMEEPLSGTRIERAEKRGGGESWTKYNTERTWDILDALLDTAKECGKSAAQVAINWLLQRPGVTAPIIGARNMQQLEDNIGASGWCLDDAQMERLNTVSDPGLPYPYEHITRARQRR